MNPSQACTRKHSKNIGKAHTILWAYIAVGFSWARLWHSFSHSLYIALSFCLLFARWCVRSFVRSFPHTQRHRPSIYLFLFTLFTTVWLLVIFSQKGRTISDIFVSIELVDSNRPFLYQRYLCTVETTLIKWMCVCVFFWWKNRQCLCGWGLISV